MRYFASALLWWLCAFCVAVALSISGEPPKPPPTPPQPSGDCQADLLVTGQYVLTQQRYRNLVEQDLARAMARINQLEAELKGKK